jgi:hypothetical protein
MSKLLINLTTAKDNPDKTVVAFVVANAGLAADQEVTIFLNIEAVRLATPGYADDISSEGFKPLKDLPTLFQRSRPGQGQHTSRRHVCRRRAGGRTAGSGRGQFELLI